MVSGGSDSTWGTVAIAAPILSFGVILMAGFGVGTSCTNDGVNRTLDAPPCDVVRDAVTWNSVVQPILLAAAVAAARLMATRRRAHLGIAAMSVAVGVGSFVWMQSY